MKRAIAAVLVCAATFIASAHAATTGPSWTAGYTLGISRTMFDRTLGDSIPEGQYGFGFGVFADVQIIPRVSFIPEILLTTKGGTFKEPVYRTAYSVDSTVSDTTFYAGDARRTMDLTYIEVPLVVQVALSPTSLSFNPHIQLGVAPSFRLLGRFRSGNVNGTEPADPDDAKRLDFGWIAGAGFNLRTRRAAMRLDLRLTQGMVNTFDTGDAPPGRNQAWTLVFAITP